MNNPTSKSPNPDPQPPTPSSQPLIPDSQVKWDRRNGTLVITMRRGKANALNLDLVEQLNTAMDQAARDGTIRGVVLGSDSPGFFSGGFDAREVFQYDRETMALFFCRFMDLYESLYLLPKPTVAAVSGHAFGGGAILAITCDLRVFARGQFGFAFSEINLGLTLPPEVERMAACAVGFQHARSMILTGDPLDPARALEIGLAHALLDPDAVLDGAIARCGALAQKPLAAYAATKQSLRRLAGGSAKGNDKSVLNDFLALWFSDEAASRRQVLLDSLNNPGKQ